MKTSLRALGTYLQSISSTLNEGFTLNFDATLTDFTQPSTAMFDIVVALQPYGLVPVANYPLPGITLSVNNSEAFEKFFAEVVLSDLQHQESESALSALEDQFHRQLLMSYSEESDTLDEGLAAGLATFSNHLERLGYSARASRWQQFVLANNMGLCTQLVEVEKYVDRWVKYDVIGGHFHQWGGESLKDYRRRWDEALELLQEIKTVEETKVPRIMALSRYFYHHLLECAGACEAMIAMHLKLGPEATTGTLSGYDLMKDELPSHSSFLASLQAQLEATRDYRQFLKTIGPDLY